MDTYFCPNCGQTFRSDECIEEGQLLRCPNCVKPRVLLNGRILITFGMIMLMITMTITLPYILIWGIVISAALCINGAIRVFRQRRARSKYSSESEDDFEDIDDIDEYYDEDEN